MPPPTYPAAHAVAAPVAAHFARHIERTASAGERRARCARPMRRPWNRSSTRRSGPACGVKKARRRASRWPSCRPSAPGIALVFEQRLALGPAMLAKVAPAVERPGIHLGVWREGGDYHVWGTTRDVPAFCLVVEVVASGLLVVKHRNEPFGKFVNVAVLEGDQIKIVDERGGKSVPDCPELVTSLIGSVDRPIAAGVNAVLVRLAASMRQHGRGGSLLVVPTIPTAGASRS